MVVTAMKDGSGTSSKWEKARVVPNSHALGTAAREM